MPVSSSTRLQMFSGGVGSLAFTFPALYTEPQDIQVNLVALTGGTISSLVYNVGYTVAVNFNNVGGTITVSPTYSAAYNYVVYRNVGQSQSATYSDYSNFPASSVTNAIDKLTMISLDNSSSVYSYGSTPSTSTSIPLGNLKIVYGQMVSASSLAITGLPFTSIASYFIYTSPIGVTMSSLQFSSIINSATSCTIYCNNTSATINWLAIGM